MVKMSLDMERYFHDLDRQIEGLYKIAREARALGLDPAVEPETNVAADIAGRVEELIGPPGVAEEIRELSKNHDRDTVSMIIAQRIIERNKDQDEQKAADLALRCALAIKTEGVVSAPLEGISSVCIKQDSSGRYLSIYFSGPIRSAGGTTQAFVVLLADQIRKWLGLGKYVATKDEIARYVEEIKLYDRVVNLQYTSTPEELEWIVSHLPVEVTGDKTNPDEVSANRNLPRVETNSVRGGACLVINDGVLSKSSKLNKLIFELKIAEWDWLKHIPKDKGTATSPPPAADDGKDKKFGDELFQGQKKDEQTDKRKVPPKNKFIAEVIAGRPIFAHPSAHGGFRIRYGRSRNMGLAGYGFHPATMYITDNFIAVGTQLRVERPGKSTVAMPVDSIEGPIVKLKGGSVIRVDTTGQKEIEAIKAKMDKVLFIGDVLIGFGEFLENNHTLVPSPYCEEWWVKEVMHAMDAAGLDRGGLAAKLNVPLATVDEWLDDFFYSKPGPAHAFLLSRELGVPLHPRHVHFWNALAPDQVKDLRDALKEGWTAPGAGRQQANLSCKNDPRIKQILELACIPHEVDKDVLHFNEESFALVETLALDKDIPGELPAGSSTVEVLTALSGTTIRDKAPHFMGMRMGRPEKAKERKMSPPVHGLFPLGHAAGNQRVLQDAMKKPVDVEIANRACPSCRQATFLPWCPKCKGRTVEYRTCPKCGETLRGHDDTCKKCNVPGQFFSPRKLNLVSTFMDAVNRLNMNIPKFKGVKGMSSVSKLPEMLEKGMLRAKNDVFVYKDGTARFDTGDCPLTHFTPKEISVGVHDLVNLGYTTDINGEPLEHPDQVLELKYQDILLPKASLKYFLQVSRFVDELLEKVYGLPRFYNIKNPKDFIGQLVIGLAPHTSAGVVGRIIGFTHANVGYAHPIYHAAKRRNCDGDEDGILLFLDVILNFSRYYLPSSIGSRMDTPLVISSRVVPEEVDGEAHNVDAGWEYPLEFYETTQQYPDPKDVKKLVHTVKDRLDTEGQYEGLGFTHPTSSINDGPKTTAYKELGSMADKIAAQFELAKKIAAVDAADQAARVIQSHFTPDIMGNLRAFTSQEFRCTKCNEKYRRPPLSGKCTKCGHEGLALTVSPASIKKYLEQALSLVREYALSAYTRQKIEMLAEKVEATVFNGTKKQLSLSEFF